MKKVFVLATIALMAASVFVGCKKGENDPGMSLKSRKARLSGEWKLTAGTMTETSPSGTDNYTFDGTNGTYTSGSSTGTFGYTQTITIEKAGTYKMVTVQTSSYTYGGTTYTDTDTDTEEGIWQFEGANKDQEIKNKECVTFKTTKYTSVSVSTVPGSTTTTSTSTYSGTDVDGGSMKLDKLSSKELVIIIDGSSTYSSGSTYTTKGSYTFEKQ